jgi:hypothetical protein
LIGVRWRIEAKDLGRDFLVVAYFRHLRVEATQTAWSWSLHVTQDEKPLRVDPKGRVSDARLGFDNHDRPAEEPVAAGSSIRDELWPAKERFNALSLQGSEDEAGRD